jgi:hypothetical protein
VAFTSCMPLVEHAGVRREHRTVVLSDVQGVGIGNALSEWLGAYLKSWGTRFRSVTSHPAMIRLMHFITTALAAHDRQVKEKYGIDLEGQRRGR